MTAITADYKNTTELYKSNNIIATETKNQHDIMTNNIRTIMVQL